MNMKIIALNICLAASFIGHASPITPIVKGATKVWDEAAKVFTKQGDDVTRAAAKGGAKVAGKSTALATKFSDGLAKSSTIPAKASEISAGKILAIGGAASGVIVAGGGACGIHTVAKGHASKSQATADNLRNNNAWAENVLKDPNSSPEAKEDARRILNQNHQRANVWANPLLILAAGVAGFFLLRGYRRKESSKKEASSNAAGDAELLTV